MLTNDFFDKKFFLASYNSFLTIEVNCYKENHVNLLICYVIILILQFTVIN